MTILRLGVCVAGVYSMFLLWAIAQERLSVPFETLDGMRTDKFTSALAMSTTQSVLCVLSSFLYILARRKQGESLAAALGLNAVEKARKSSDSATEPKGHSNGRPSNDTSNGSAEAYPFARSARSDRRALLSSFLTVSFLLSLAAPFGFAALAYLPYPAMVLAKSCKLVPVLLMNVLMYRRKFKPYKYAVVALVTLGIGIFMGAGGDKRKHAKHGSKTAQGGGNEWIGMIYLLVNLAIDGAINSAQDEIFDRFTGVKGQQMMFWINLFSSAITTTIALLPLPHIPVLRPASSVLKVAAASNAGFWAKTEAYDVLQFLGGHRGVAQALLMFACTGALGQLFIFETLEHFGSLTLVMVTLTRKMGTMILSVLVYGHKLSTAQWAGAGIVFSGISLEAYVKMEREGPQGVHMKQVIQEKERAEIKDL